MNSRENSPSPLSVAQFQARAVSGKPKNYALALSSRPQAVSLFGDMEWDAQAGFFALSQNRKGAKEPIFDAERCFAQEPSLLRINPLVGFVPKAQEEQALAAFRRLFGRWAQGQDSDLGYFVHGPMTMGFKFTPSGMIFAIGASSDVQSVSHLDRGWREERILDSGLSIVNAGERALDSMAPQPSGSDQFEKIDFTRQSTMIALRSLSDVSGFLRTGTEVSAPITAPDWMKDDPVFAALSRRNPVPQAVATAKNPIAAEFASFLRCEVDARAIKDAMAASAMPKQELSVAAEQKESAAAPMAIRRAPRI